MRRVSESTALQCMTQSAGGWWVGEHVPGTWCAVHAKGPDTRVHSATPITPSRTRELCNTVASAFPPDSVLAGVFQADATTQCLHVFDLLTYAEYRRGRWVNLAFSIQICPLV